MAKERKIYVTETDLSRLEALVDNSSVPNIEALRDELSQAIVVRSENIPPDVVTMNSKIRFRDMDTGEESEMTLVYPGSANVEKNQISIMAPVGSAVFGLSVNDEIEWPMPSKKRALKIISILYQPEAEGRYDL